MIQRLMQGIYESLCKLLFQKNGNLRRSFLRTSISLDISKKVILGWKISQKTDNEIKHANALIRQSNKMRKSDCYVMDRDDSEKNPFYN